MKDFYPRANPCHDRMNSFTVIDENNWKRREHCAVFRNYVEPSFCMTVELDVTEFLATLRDEGYSFTMSMIWLVSKCANEIEEFRYRFLSENVVLFDRIDTSFAYMDEGDDLFKVVNVPFRDSMREYVTEATRIAKGQRGYFVSPPSIDVFQFSPIPWVTYTHISHTNPGRKNNVTPMFDWGRYRERDGRVVMPFSVQVHHSFVDGIHVGHLIENIQAYMDEY